MKRIFFVTGGDSVRVPASIPCRRSRTRWPPCAPRSRKQQVVIAQLLTAHRSAREAAAAASAASTAGSAGRHQGAGRLGQLAARDRQQQGEPERLLQLQVLRRRLGRADGLPAAPSRRADGEAARQVQLPHGARAAERAAPSGNRPENGEEHAEEAAEERQRSRHQRRRPGGRRERVDGIQPQPLLERSRRQAAVAAILVAEPLSEPDAVDHASHLPPRAVPGGTGRRDGAGVGGHAGRHVRVRRRLQVLRRQQQLRGQQPHRSPATASRGARAGRCAFRPAERCGASTWRPMCIAATSV